MLIFRPRASRIAPNDAEAMPLPSDDTTPPVTKTNRFIVSHRRLFTFAVRQKVRRISQTKPKGTMGIRREFRLADRRVPDNPSASLGHEGTCLPNDPEPGRRFGHAPTGLHPHIR